MDPILLMGNPNLLHEPRANSSDIYTAAFQHWLTTRQHLAEAIQGYAWASSMLDTVFRVTPRQPSARDSLNRGIAAVDFQLKYLLQDEQKLHTTRSTLAQLRNGSRQFALINNLPTEVLTTIFNLACASCRHRSFTGEVTPEVISGVCTMWRQLSFSVPSLWCHIDIDIIGSQVDEKQYLRMNLWASRAQSMGLHLHITEQNEEKCRVDECFPESQYEALTRFVRPLMPRVCGLEVISRCGLEDHISNLISLWIQHGTTRFAKVLAIEHRHCDTSLSIYLPTSASRQSRGLATLDEFQSFFESLNTLQLHGVIIQPSNTIYRGLAELHLYDCLHDCDITQSRLSEILSACPKLRSLKLVGVDILKDVGFTPNPVAMDYLEVLCMLPGENNPGANAIYALPLISGGSVSLSVAFTLMEEYLNAEFVSIIHQYLARSNVKVLHVYGSTLNVSVAALLTYIPRLHTLVIDHCDLSEGAIERFVASNTSISGLVLDPWPQLNTLYVVDCKGVKPHLQQLVALHPIQCLRAHWIKPGEQASFANTLERQDLEKTLHAIIPDVECCDYDSDNDPTDDWNVFPVLACDHESEES